MYGRLRDFLKKYIRGLYKVRNTRFMIVPTGAFVESVFWLPGLWLSQFCLDWIRYEDSFLFPARNLEILLTNWETWLTRTRTA